MQIISNACELLTPRRLKRNDFADDFNPIRIGGGRNQPYGLLIAFKHAKMEKLKNKNLKKRPPLAPTPHQYPGIHRIYTYALHRPCGMLKISENGQLRNFADI